MIRIRTGSRLHFGLLDPAGVCGRRYGGAGIMVEEPGIEVEVARAPTLSATGPLAERALGFARRLLGSSRSEWRQASRNAEGHPGTEADETPHGGKSPAALVRVLSSAREHVGLGTGTQLALAVASGLAILRGKVPRSDQLALQVGRGERSAIGVHGFEHGGFVVEGGKAKEDEISTLLARLPVPEAWRFVLVVPRGQRAMFGEREREAFRRLELYSEEEVRVLSHLLLLDLLPALARGDLAAFGEALRDYGRRAGKPFRATQGGVFSSPLVNDVVSFLESEGVGASGQSSWGPTSYGLVADEDRARHLVSRLRQRFGFSEGEVFLAKARNRGAFVAPERPASTS